ncbi:MAG: hypothetical protein PSX37_11150, partial [bacterium]|nr:hypothetical protein [bacterium]
MVTRSRESRGFILADVLVASVLLAIALSVIVSMSGSALSSQAMGEQISVAATLADEQLNLVLMRGPDDYAARYSAEGPCEAPFEMYRYKLEFIDGDAGNPYTVTARIEWTSPRGPQ